jgi:hypothetical protein
MVNVFMVPSAIICFMLNGLADWSDFACSSRRCQAMSADVQSCALPHSCASWQSFGLLQSKSTRSAEVDVEDEFVPQPRFAAMKI